MMVETVNLSNQKPIEKQANQLHQTFSNERP